MADKVEVKSNQIEELISLPVINSLDCRFATGPTMGKWFQGLKNMKFYATKCPTCGRTQTPPREACAICVSRTDEWVQVGPGGAVVNYDIVYYASPDPLTGKVRETPYVTLYILMDGATLEDCFAFDGKMEDIPRLKAGVRVKPVWAEKRIGNISDIIYFEIDE